MEIIIFVLVLGFVAYWCIRHPIKTMKFIFSVVGLLVLGTLVIGGFVYLIAHVL